LAAGIYKASFKKMGYAGQVVTVNVSDDEITVVEVKLSKNSDFMWSARPNMMSGLHNIPAAAPRFFY
jgi:hypothetical protein